jgi:hypothetical protein
MCFQQRVRLVGIDADLAGRRRLDAESGTDLVGRPVLGLRPVRFLRRHLARQHPRRTDIIVDGTGLADGNPPVELADDVDHLGRAMVVELELVPLILELRLPAADRGWVGKRARIFQWP